jgi:trimeric autotransporter adhesin
MKQQGPFVPFASCCLLAFSALVGPLFGQTPSASKVSSRNAGPSSATRMQPGKTAFADTAPGVITTVVADRGCRGCSGGIAGDGGLARDAQLSGPRGIFVDSSGNLLIADSLSHRIRRVDSVTGTIATVAGGPHCFQGRCDGFFGGDGGLATAAQLNNPTAVVADADGNLFISDTNNNRVRRVDHVTGIITTVVGSFRGFSGDGGPARNAELNAPMGLALDAAGNLFIADSGNSRVRRVDALNGIITTVAGSGRGSVAKDGQTATSAGLFQPSALFIERSGDLLIGSINGIYRLDQATGRIKAVTGAACRGSGGDGGPAVEACLSYANGLVEDAAGNLFIGDLGNHRIRRVDHATGVITTVAGTGEAGFGGGFAGDGGPASEAKLMSPQGVAVDAAGNLFIADSNNNRIRRIQMASTPNAELAHKK